MLCQYSMNRVREGLSVKLRNLVIYLFSILYIEIAYGKRKLDYINNQMAKEIKISNFHFLFAFGVMICNEIYALYRFNGICKRNSVVGTTLGFLGFTKENSDDQWRDFEGNLSLIMAFQVAFLIFSQLVKQSSSSKTRYHNLKLFNILVGMTFSFVMFNLGMVFQFALVIIYYQYQKYFQRMRFFVPILWVAAILTLCCNEKFQGYRFASIHSSLATLDDVQKEFAMERWHIMFNLILLRILSFTLDHHWARTNQFTRKNIINFDSQKTYKDLVQEGQPLPEYNFTSYLAYIYYSPLFFAGPTTTFNAFNAQLKIPQKTYNRAQVFKYVLRVYLLDYGTFQIFLHLVYPCAIAKLRQNLEILKELNIYELHMMGFINLIFLWYKFLTIWRITRAWALMDGVETPENMNRCIYNNHNFQGFWRSWHRSFNQWLIRYIYIPLGGSKLKALNMWIVFTFVAMWHDFKLDLILWAWIICLALVPEILLISYFNKERFYQKVWFKPLTILACAIQVEMMCLANLIGFGAGHEGLKHILDQYLTFNGALFLLAYVLIRDTSAVTIQFRIRESEKKDHNEKNF